MNLRLVYSKITVVSILFTLSAPAFATIKVNGRVEFYFKENRIIEGRFFSVGDVRDRTDIQNEQLSSSLTESSCSKDTLEVIKHWSEVGIQNPELENALDLYRVELAEFNQQLPTKEIVVNSYFSRYIISMENGSPISPPINTLEYGFLSLSTGDTNRSSTVSMTTPEIINPFDDATNAEFCEGIARPHILIRRLIEKIISRTKEQKLENQGIHQARALRAQMEKSLQSK